MKYSLSTFLVLIHLNFQISASSLETGNYLFIGLPCAGKTSLAHEEFNRSASTNIASIISFDYHANLFFWLNAWQQVTVDESNEKYLQYISLDTWDSLRNISEIDCNIKMIKFFEELNISPQNATRLQKKYSSIEATWRQFKSEIDRCLMDGKQIFIDLPLYDHIVEKIIKDLSVKDSSTWFIVHVFCDYKSYKNRIEKRNRSEKVSNHRIGPMNENTFEKYSLYIEKL